MLTRTGIAAGLLCVLIASQAGYGAIASTFDTDLDGWSMVKANGTLQWDNPGGNPGGRGFFTDTRDGLSSIKAPPKFLGDKSSYVGGDLAFDYKVIDFGAKVARYMGIKVTFYNGRSHYTYKLATPVAAWETAGWQTFTIPLTSAAWNVSDARWNTMMANLTKIEISMESAVNRKRPYDTDAIDNVVMSGLGEPIPEPGTLAVLALGVVGLLRRKGVSR